MTRVVLVLVLLLTAAVGCDSCKPEAPASAAPIATPTAKGFGAIEGTIRLAEGAELPEILPRMMFQQVLQQAEPLPSPPECTPAKQTDRRPVGLGPNNLLSSIFVTASNFKTQPPSRGPIVHNVTVTDCRLTPMVIGAKRGDSLRLTSNTEYPFMPQVGTAAFTETLIKGQERVHTLEALGVQSIVCGFTAPCGRADIITVDHTLYALSDANGHFRIEGIPADETLDLTAWHPLFLPTAHSVKISANETTKLDFVLVPDHAFTPTGQEEARRRAEEAARPVPPGTRPD